MEITMWYSISFGADHWDVDDNKNSLDDNKDSLDDIAKDEWFSEYKNVAVCKFRVPTLKFYN